MLQIYSFWFREVGLNAEDTFQCVKYLSKNTLKTYYFKILLKSFFGVYVLCFTISIVDNVYFYFTTFLKNIMYFLLHTFSLTPKSTHNSHTYQENIPGHPYCLWSGGLSKHKCLVCKLCLSFGVCPWLSVHFKNKWWPLVCLI